MLKSLARYERANGAEKSECHCGLKRVVCKVLECLAYESVYSMGHFHTSLLTMSTHYQIKYLALHYLPLHVVL